MQCVTIERSCACVHWRVTVPFAVILCYFRVQPVRSHLVPVPFAFGFSLFAHISCQCVRLCVVIHT